jgi:uncharacterized delta-60 repeat protein
MQKLRSGEGTVRALLALWWLAGMAGGLAPAKAQSTFQFAVPTYSIYENGTNITVAVIRSGDTSVPGSVNFATSDGPPPNDATAGADYTGTNGVLSFAPGEIVKTFDVFITNPVLLDMEFDEHFTITLSNPMGGELGLFSTADVLIFDDDTCFAFANSPNGLPIVDEDVTNAIIRITRFPPSSGRASVLLQTFDGPAQGGAGAMAPADYTSLSTNLVFDPGQDSIEIAIPIIDDCLVETNAVSSNRLESIILMLSQPNGARVGMPGCPTNVAVLNIRDNDTVAGQIAFTFDGPQRVMEDETRPLVLRVRVSRLCGTNGQVSVDFEMFNDVNVLPPNLCNGQTDAYWSGQRPDYVFNNSVIFANGLPGGTLTWADGDAQDKFIEIFPIDDERVELDESIFIRLVRPRGGASISAVRRTYQYIIQNDDVPAGSADSDYNTLGALNPTPGANSTVYASVTYPDGTERTLIGGDFSAVNAIVRNGVARILTNGFVDTTFDPGSGADGFVSSIVLQPDGRVLVGGGFTSMDNISRYGIARLNANGSLDTTFDVGAGANGSVHAIALQPNGRVIIAGDFTTFDNVPRQRIARLNANGSLDLSFDPGAGPDDVVYALALQGDGKVILGGDFKQVDGQFNNRIARLQSNGSIDNAWLPIAGADGTVYAIRLQANGQAVIGGAFRHYDGEEISGLARLRADGSLDQTFGACYGIDGAVYAVAIQTDGKILIGGDFVAYNQTGRTNLARVLTDGSLDTTFLDSFYNESQPGTDSFVAAVSLQQDGNVIIGGSFSVVGGGWDFLLPPLTRIVPPRHTEIRFNYARVLGNFTVPGPSITNFSTAVENSPGNLQFVQGVYPIDEDVLGGVLSVTVQRTNGGLGGVRVHYQTVDGSAKSNIDYVPVSGTVSWADCLAGVRFIPIRILDNGVVDGNKNFFVELTQPESFGPFQTNQPALGFNCRAEVVIVDDDEAHGVIGFAKPIYSFKENVFDANITVIRTNGSEGIVTVQYQTLNGSATGGTLPSTTNDFRTITNGTLTFGTGETNKSFPVRINDDILSEFEENFSVRLFNVTGGGTLGNTNATVLIFDNETIGAGSISFSATDYTVSESGGQASITLRRTGASQGTVSVEFRTTDLPPGTGAARAFVDYGGITNTITFGAGVTQQVVQIPILGDLFVEGPEQVALSVSGVTGGASIGFINNATLTIQDDDAYGALGFGAVSYYVPEEGGVALIDVVRIGGDAEDVTVDFQVLGGSATDTLDFISTNGTLTFPNGVTVQTISVPILNDPDLEGPETVLLSLFNFTKASAGFITNAVLVINDNESQAVPAGSIDTSFSPVPGPNGFVNTIAIQPDGQILVGGEFTAFGGVGRRRVARMNIDGSVDLSFEPATGADGDVHALALQPDGKVIVGGAFMRMGNRNRSHIARLTSSGALDTSFNPGSGADNPVFALALQPDGRILLGGDFATFNGISRKGITRIHPNGVNDATFQPGTGAGGTVFALALLPDGRILVGGDFTTFNNQNVAYLCRLNPDGSVDGTFDNSTPLDGNVRAIAVQPDGRIVIGGSFTMVGGTPRPYIARLNADGSLDGTFDPGPGADSIVYSIALQSDGKILIGGEFTSVGGLTQNRLARLQNNGALDTSINFGTGANLFVATVVLQSDASIVIGGGFTQFNGVPRNFIARLVGGEDITPGTLQFIQPAYSVLESGTNVTVTIARAGGSQGQVEVDLISTDLGSAIGGIDYGIVNERLIFTPGETVKTIVVGITNDTLLEPNEVFQLALTNVSGGALLNDAAVTYITIVNDDSAVGFTFPAFSVNEKVIGGNAVIGVVRAGATNDPVTVDFATVAIPGAATPFLDFIPASGTLSFLPGQTNLTFSVPILDDLLVEGNELFEVMLNNLTGPAVIALGQAPVSIIDNDFSPGSLSFNATAYNVSESNATLTITILRTNGASGVVTVNWTAGGGTAFSGIDYIAPGGVVSLADGETNESFTIHILDDLMVEGNETFILTLSNPTGGSVISGPSAVLVTIEDDEFGPGSLDPTFNPGTGANSPVRSVAVGPDGAVVAGGEFTNFNGFARGYLVRLNLDGTVDLAFDSSAGANAAVFAVGVYADGRVAAGGTFTTFAGRSFGRVLRVGTNGLPDPLWMDSAGVNNGTVTALQTGPSASLILGGGFTQPSPSVARFLSDGRPDSTFTPGTGTDPMVHALAAHPAGGFVIGGAFTNVNGVSRMHVAKLFASGLLDLSFNPRVVSGGFVYAVAVQPDGRVLIGGSFTRVDNLVRSGIARFNPNGALDLSFNTGLGANSEIRSIALQPDGRILVAGSFTNFNGVTRMRVARLESTGAVDPVFDPGRGADNTVYSVALEPDGKVVIGGSFTMVNGFIRNGVARLNGDQPVVQFAAAGMGGTGPLFNLRTTPGGLYVIDATTDFVSWSALSTNRASSYNLIFTDPSAHNLNKRFYRARQVPR